MKTTIDLPEDVLKKGKIAAAKRGTSFKQLVIEGLESVLKKDETTFDATDALARLRKGYELGGKSPMTREEIHVR
jgi:hypothetical protein